MSILTIVFSEQIANPAMSSPVGSVAITMLSIGLVGIAATLLTVWKAKQVRNKNILAKHVQA